MWLYMMKAFSGQSLIEETDGPCLSELFIHDGKECIGLTQDEPEIKYLLLEGMPRKVNLLAKLWRPIYIPH